MCGRMGGDMRYGRKRPATQAAHCNLWITLSYHGKLVRVKIINFFSPKPKNTLACERADTQVHSNAEMQEDTYSPSDADWAPTTERLHKTRYWCFINAIRVCDVIQSIERTFILSVIFDDLYLWHSIIYGLTTWYLRILVFCRTDSNHLTSNQKM